MKHNVDGKNAEDSVANYLMSQGFKVLEQNWKTPKCEIDIIAIKDNCIYFVEVKYRGTNLQGDGFEYVTPAKIKQMSYAANLWVATNNWEGEYCLSAAAVSGFDYSVDFIEEL
jgi:putative endonuclease